MVPESDNDDARTVEVKGGVYALATHPESKADPKVKVKGCAYALAGRPESGSYGGGRRPFRLWRLFVVSPSGKQVVVIWNRDDLVSRVKENLELKIGLPYGLQVLRKRGVEKPLVDDHLLYKSNIRDGGVIVASVYETTSFQIFVKGRNGKTYVLWMNSLDKVDDIKHKIELKDGTPVKE